MKIKSWGMHPLVDSETFTLENSNKLSKYISKNKSFIPFGNGRSYGDSALYKRILLCKNYNQIIKFDENLGILECQSGVLLSEIIEHCIEKGWFLKITPGTKLITVGGAIASDIHGKNHHKDGCFSECVEEFTLMLPDDGKIIKCSKKLNSELFFATCGGMGLTGVILSARIKLKKVNSIFINQRTIKSKNLKDTFQAFENQSDQPYSVAWIDCLSKGNKLGRSVLMVGDFANDGILKYKKGFKLNLPFNFPSFFISKWTVKLFNFFYYNFLNSHDSIKKVNFDSFFYPLDKINNWNRMYGKNGFTQYQFILPKETSYEGLKEILNAISRSGKGSFLAVLKLYGSANKNFLSFPMEGYSLALDFKIEPGLFQLLDQLDELVLKFNGRIYLSKDVRVPKKVFEIGYPLIENFRDIRKSYKMKQKIKSFQSIRLDI